MTKEEILACFPFAAEIPAGLRDEMIRLGTVAEIPAGTFYFHTGDPCRGVGLLGRGSIRVFKIGANGREITLYHVGAGHSCHLTFNGALCGEPYPAESLVEEDVTALVLPPAAFAAWVDREPTLRRYVFRAMAGTMTGLMGLVDDIAFGRLDRRLAEYLHHAFRTGPGGEGALQATHEQIAAELGTAREVISRLLKTLEREGILSLSRGRLALLDAGRLQAMAR